MPTFEPGQIVRLPFPYVERNATKHRPGLVLAAFPDREFLWVAMITSAANAPWPEDIMLSDLKAAGLSKSSVIRPAKIAMVGFDVAKVIGRCTPSEMNKVRDAIIQLVQ